MSTSDWGENVIATSRQPGRTGQPLANASITRGGPSERPLQVAVQPRL